LEAGEIDMMAAAGVVVMAAATPFVSGNSGAAIGGAMTAMDHSVTYVFLFLA